MPVSVPQGVDFKVAGTTATVKGPKGELSLELYPGLELGFEDQEIRVQPKSADSGLMAIAGTTRSLLKNMVTGVSQGFERKLELRGVGYRANAQGKVLNLTLGFSHPVNYQIPEGVTVETPSQTEISIKGVDKQKVGQVAAEIRAYRPPEPYKGKGVRYVDERVRMKEAKKK